jgi:hypothetical protein
MKENFTYSYLDIPNIDDIQLELDSFYQKIKDNQVVDVKNKDNVPIMQLHLDNSNPVASVGHLTKYTFIHCDINETMQKLPKLNKFFNSTGIELLRIAIIVTHPNSTQDPHIDQGPERLAINFPLAGTGETFTQMFKNKGILKYVTSIDENKTAIKEQRRYLQYFDEDLEELGRYVLNRPVILNVKMPHSVVNLSNDERIGISFRFKQDPWHLIKEENI